MIYFDTQTQDKKCSFKNDLRAALKEAGYTIWSEAFRYWKVDKANKTVHSTLSKPPTFYNDSTSWTIIKSLL